jgi:hypothetical protein
VAQKWLGFASDLGAQEYWASIQETAGVGIFKFIFKTAF